MEEILNLMEDYQKRHDVRLVLSISFNGIGALTTFPYKSNNDIDFNSIPELITILKS